MNFKEFLESKGIFNTPETFKDVNGKEINLNTIADEYVTESLWKGMNKEISSLEEIQSNIGIVIEGLYRIRFEKSTDMKNSAH